MLTDFTACHGAEDFSISTSLFSRNETARSFSSFLSAVCITLSNLKRLISAADVSLNAVNLFQLSLVKSTLVLLCTVNNLTDLSSQVSADLFLSLDELRH